MNRIKNAFEPVKASEELKTSTAYFLQQEIGKKSEVRRPRSIRRALIAACTVLLLTVGVGGYAWAQTPVSYISIDVNPSIELSLNRLDRVVSAVAYNEDGALVLEGLTLKGKPYTEAIDLILNSSTMSTYLKDDAALTLTVASDREAKLLAGVEGCDSCIQLHSAFETAAKNAIGEAHANGLSFGKYHAYQKLLQYNKALTAEECKQLTMRQLGDMLTQYQGGTMPGGQGAGSTNGQQNSYQGAATPTDPNLGNGYTYGQQNAYQGPATSTDGDLGHGDTNGKQNSYQGTATSTNLNPSSGGSQQSAGQGSSAGGDSSDQSGSGDSDQGSSDQGGESRRGA